MDDAHSLINETGYPLIAKPDDGVGAIATYRLNGDQDLAAFFETKPDTDYIMEEFISGSIYSFDGLADRSGNPVFYTAHTFSQGIMETVNQARHLYYYSLRDIPAGLEKVGRECLRAFNVKERFFHIEFFQTAADQYVSLEVNMRPPGGYTTDMFNFACDIDIYRIWAELLVHHRTDVHYTRDYHCCYASRKFNQRYLHSQADILARYGSFFDYEGMGMIEAIEGFINGGNVKLYCVDSVDEESWYNFAVSPSDRNARHEVYDRYIVEEVIPFIRNHCQSPHERVMANGCSMGAYHALNFFLKHPDVFQGTIALSGLYRLDRPEFQMTADELHGSYFNSPLSYLPGLTDSWYLEQYRRSQIIVCVGQGPWEDEAIEDTRQLDYLFGEKSVPAWIDYWGHDVNHDWPWWYRQMNYFLGRLYG